MLKLRKMLKKNRKGFTLIELIVVIAILAIIALLAIPRFLGVLDNARVRTHNANVRTIESAATIYEAETGNYVTNISDLIPEYLNENPGDPRTPGSTASYSVTSTEAGGIVVTPEYDDSQD